MKAALVDRQEKRKEDEEKKEEERQEFAVPNLSTVKGRSNTPPLKFIQLWHDESIFHAFEGKSTHWGDGTTPVLLSKSRGDGLMASDFICLE
jgi:hypothetical protein